MATPHVAGVAAALWSYFPNCTSVQIRNVLNKSAKYMPKANPEEKCTPQYGHGLVQLSDAYDMITQGGCAAGGDNSIVTGGCDQLNNIDMTESPTTSSSPSTSPTKSKSPSTSFAPSTSPPTDFPTIGCADDEFGVMVRIITDYWANVDFNYWTITDMRGIEVWRVENHESDKIYDSVRKCLTKAPYTFTIHDGYGDGIPVNPVSDSFNVFVDGVKEIQGQTFTYKFEEKFAEEYTVPTITPTISPTDQMTDSPIISPTITPTISSTDQRTDSPTISPTQTITDCEDSDKVHVKVEITTNSNPLETKWLIKSTGSYEDIVMSSPIYTTNYTEYSSMKCLDIDEKFLFTIVDSNGLCDGYDKCGSYKLSLNNVSFVAGGGTEQRNFDDNYTISFPLEVTETDSPTATPTSSTTVEPTCPPNESAVSVEILTDKFAYVDKTSWTITNYDGEVLMSGEQLESSKTYFANGCLGQQEYNLTVVDEKGDGICGEPRNSCGHVKVFKDKTEIVSVGASLAENFEYITSKTFVLSPTDSPTGKPTKSTTTPIPTFSPTTSPTVAGCADVPPFDCVWLLNKEISDFNSYCSKMLPFVDEPVLKECGQNFLNFANMCEKNQPTE